MKGDVADVASRRELLFVKQPFANHNGGEVLTGPDGMLYIGLGDGGSAGDPMDNGQDLGTLLGKILRINPKASRDRPVLGPGQQPVRRRTRTRGPRSGSTGCGIRGDSPSTAPPATCGSATSGRTRSKRSTSRRRESGGLNFGWSQREGTQKYKGDRPAGAVDPVYEYSHDDGGIAVTGGYVYRGKRIPNLVGAYLWADEVRGHITALQFANGRVVKSRPLDGVIDSGLSSFGEDNAGELYVLDIGRGRVVRIDPA